MGNWAAALNAPPQPADAWPLVAHGPGGLDRTFAWRGGHPISVAGFLHDVAAVAARLPSTAHVLNACSDRYLFAVSLAAGMQRGIVTLLPPARTPGVIAHLRAEAPDLVLLIDRDEDPAGERRAAGAQDRTGRVRGADNTAVDSAILRNATGGAHVFVRVDRAAATAAETLGQPGAQRGGGGAAAGGGGPRWHRPARHRAGAALLRLRVDRAGGPRGRRHADGVAAVLSGRHRCRTRVAAAATRTRHDAVSPAYRARRGARAATDRSVAVCDGAVDAGTGECRRAGLPRALAGNLRRDRMRTAGNATHDTRAALDALCRRARDAARRSRLGRRRARADADAARRPDRTRGRRRIRVARPRGRHGQHRRQAQFARLPDAGAVARARRRRRRVLRSGGGGGRRGTSRALPRRSSRRASRRAR